ncbi:glycosyltransferase [Leucobacter sp. HY1908]
MRVIIATRIYRPEPAAASLFLGGVADALREAGHEVEVLTASPLPGQGEGSRGERIRTFPVLRDASGYLRGYVQYMSFDVPLAFRLLFARRPGVVFVEPPPTTGAVVRVVCALRRIPYVYDAADIWSDAAGHATSSGLVVKVLRALERFAMRGAAQLVTISQGVVDRVRALGVTVPMTVTGFGADTEVFRYEEQPPQKLFLYAGTYTGLHGAQVLIDAFAEFTSTHPGYRLRFIGNGTGQDEMRVRARELGVQGTVEFADPVTAEELRPQLASAVASLATLRPGGGYEYAFTSKIYSSLATGCPVIFAGPGPTGPFIRRAIDEAPTGSAVASTLGTAVEYTPGAIASAMRQAADRAHDPTARRELAHWAAAHHSMQAVAQRVATVIEETVIEETVIEEVGGDA